MNIGLIKNGVCENIAVFENLELAKSMLRGQYEIFEVAEGFGIGDLVVDGEWRRISINPEETQVSESIDQVSR